MAQERFTAAIAEAQSMQYIDVAGRPDVIHVAPGPGALDIADLPVRTLVGMRHCYLLLDIQDTVDIDTDAKTVAETFAETGVDALPGAMRPAAAVPPGTKVALIVRDIEAGKVQAVLHYSFAGSVALTVARSLLRGAEASPHPRTEAIWNVKKGFQLMVSRVCGYHVRWAKVEPRQGPGRRSTSGDSWQPSKQEVEDGLRFIIDELPPDGEGLEQQMFSIVNRYNPSPIQGWPNSEVERAIRRTNALRMEADIEYFYPLLVSSFKPVFRDEILPVMLTKARTHGVLVAGPPGIGKTPLMKVWGLLIGRYWAREKQLRRKPCIRRGKKFERFRSKAQDICESLLLDDPVLPSIPTEEILDWFELAESGSGSGRYSDTKLALNASRSILTNILDYTKEPAADTPFTKEHFWGMVSKTFGDISEETLLSIFKRCITLVAGKRHLVLRMPDVDKDAPIRVYTENDIALDFLTENHKEYLSLLKNGTKAKFPGYDAMAEDDVEWASDYINGVALVAAKS